MKHPRYLGLDIGSVSVSVVEMSGPEEVTRSWYRYHHGGITETVSEILKELDDGRPITAGCTASAAPFLEGAASFDNRLSLLEGSRFFFTGADAVLDVGAEKFTLYLFNEDGSFHGLTSSTSCAAGTGGFLDQQARRLALSGSSELSRLAGENTGPIPKIASRCAVFAKTDIIHAQQEGYSLEQICDGLCEGLARTITATLFSSDIRPNLTAFTGGVSKNDRVSHYISELSGTNIITHSLSHCAAAAGACLLVQRSDSRETQAVLPGSIVHSSRSSDHRKYYYDPLNLSISNYPNFSDHESFLYRPRVVDWNMDIEIDVYQRYEGTLPVCIGIDIGSTSTKAMIIDGSGEPVVGLYTRTSGRPLFAVQAIFEAASFIQERHHLTFDVQGTATTGSGRKFIGAIIGSDLVLDEISAHAAAAYKLDPNIDTIIEIGGQDSKFTRIRGGVVTFSQMNNVCAAGTGSFIEEQADRLNVSIRDVSRLVEGASSPLASDRCTVFMERDINHYMAEGYRVSEILTAVLHSIRENYLTKVASQSLGKRICFQGATAKNRALVAAFEHKLRQPVTVSRYCHLTGALGAALEIRKSISGQSSFKGLSIYVSPIPVRTEGCELCGNHCRLRIARVNGKDEAFGFLCGRDYTTRRYVSKPAAVNLLDQRTLYLHGAGKSASSSANGSIAAPLGLHLLPEVHLWRHFFASLGLQILFAGEADDPAGIGKTLAGAEFCAPMAAFHAHVRKASNMSDTLFLPAFLDIRSTDPFPGRSCYYTQFSVPVVKASLACLKHKKIVSPVLSFRAGRKDQAGRLFDALKEVYPGRFTPKQVELAYLEAAEDYNNRRLEMAHRTEEKLETLLEKIPFAVVLTGRPYTVLDDSMNKGIPGLIASLGVPVLFQDMLTSDFSISREYLELIQTFHWQYARNILTTAARCAADDWLYPVFLTSFKCSPDSFVMEYFKRILDAAGKPYLILQLDEHDSRVGYETRIEAALRSFRNHFASPPQRPETALPVKPHISTTLDGKTLVFPNWDPLCIPLIAANLVHAGYDARVLREDQAMIAESMRLNTGQCIPVNAIAYEYARFINDENLDPGNTLLWIARSHWSCNIQSYPYYIKSLLESEGGGLEDAGVYIGELSHIELSPLLTLRAYFAYMFGGVLRKIGCALRPYEIERGAVDRAIDSAQRLFLNAFQGGMSFVAASRQTAALFRAVRTDQCRKPLVAIFGDMYVRDNPVMNQGLVHTIESAGGEAIVTPYNEYVKIVAGAYFNRWKLEGRHSDIVVFKTLLTAMRILEKFYARYFRPLIPKPFSPDYSRISEELRRYALDVQHEGESFDNILKIEHILEAHPDVSLFVQTNPAFCCPSIITEAMKGRIEEITGVPVVTITYDGTGADKNDVIVPYIAYGARPAAL